MDGPELALIDENDSNLIFEENEEVDENEQRSGNSEPSGMSEEDNFDPNFVDEAHFELQAAQDSKKDLGHMKISDTDLIEIHGSDSHGASQDNARLERELAIAEKRSRMVPGLISPKFSQRVPNNQQSGNLGKPLDFDPKSKLRRARQTSKSSKKVKKGVEWNVMPGGFESFKQSKENTEREPGAHQGTGEPHMIQESPKNHQNGQIGFNQNLDNGGLVEGLEQLEDDFGDADGEVVIGSSALGSGNDPYRLKSQTGVFKSSTGNIDSRNWQGGTSPPIDAENGPTGYPKGSGRPRYGSMNSKTPKNPQNHKKTSSSVARNKYANPYAQEPEEYPRIAVNGVMRKSHSRKSHNPSKGGQRGSRTPRKSNQSLRAEKIPEVDNRDFYVPRRKPGGFTISKAPRFSPNYRNFDVDNLRVVKKFEMKDHLKGNM